jgi:hypothetical protein
MCWLRAGIDEMSEFYRRIMRARVFLLLVAFATAGFSQQNNAFLDELYKPVPVHFVKIDLLKSAVCQLHCNYEFYNGKHLGEEIGFSFFYPNRVISFINEEPGDLGWFDRTAGHYHGYGIEFTQKFYFPEKHWDPYLGLLFSYKYKHCENANVWIIDEFRSSSYSFNEQVSSRRYIESASLLVGFASGLQHKILVDIHIGLGLGYFDVRTTHENVQEWYSIAPGHEHFYAPVFKCGVKLCFGMRRKEK